MLSFTLFFFFFFFFLLLPSVAYGTDHSECDSLAIVFMSHGEQDILYGRNGSFKADFLFESFNTDQCKSLAGKPKLFFIQVRIIEAESSLLVIYLCVCVYIYLYTVYIYVYIYNNNFNGIFSCSHLKVQRLSFKTTYDLFWEKCLSKYVSRENEKNDINAK